MAGNKLKTGMFAAIMIVLLASGGVMAHAEKTDNVQTPAVVQDAETGEEAKNISKEDALSAAVELYENLGNTVVEIPAEMQRVGEKQGIDETYLKAVVLGYANIDDYADTKEADSIQKQDFLNILYKAVINYDSEYAIDGEEADLILNNCYDNAYINEENRVAYAFMIKHGIIAQSGSTEPEKLVTDVGCDIVINEISDFFSKEISFDFDDEYVTIGANISTVLETLGKPNRIDKSVYDFEWYVYNADPAKFIMIGVRADRICAVYSNSESFGTGIVSIGDAYVRASDYKDDEAFSFYTDSKGNIDAILYNKCDKSSEKSNDDAADGAAQIVDMINAYRAKNGAKEYVLDDALSESAAEAASAYAAEGSESENTTYETGFDVFTVYNSLVRSENSILTDNGEKSLSVGAGVYMDIDYNLTFAFNSGAAVKTPSAEEKTTVEPKKPEITIEEITEATTPVIVTPQNETVYNEGDDVVISLAMRAATEYHVEVFDIENDEYAVNEYIKTDKTEITLPAELFENGADYRMVISSITEDGMSLSSEDVLFSYGADDESALTILTPFSGGSTDDDYLAVSWESDKYHDFMIDLYDDEGTLITSEIVKDKNEAVIRGVDPGDYHIYVTALRRDTNIEKAQASAKVSVNMPEPVITETILEPDDTYYFVYDDPEMGVLYFYDEEIVDVEQKNSKGKTETVQRKKIIQKQVKATKAYKELAKDRRIVTSVTGEPTLDFLTSVPASEMGQKIVDEASKYLGVPYLWGGTTPSGFDCSGLVQYVLKNLGINISRVTQTQCKEGVAVAKGDLQPGDLVFFESNGDVHHVGIYVGNGQMLHAPHTGDVVRITDMNTPYYTSSYYCARRVY